MAKSHYSNLKNSKNINGIYRARVENNIDPLGIGRIQIRVPLLHGLAGKNGLSSANLPWATMCSVSAGFNYGTYIVPEIGEYVFVLFEDGDPYKPVYIGSVFGTLSTVNKEYGSIETGGIWYGRKGDNEVPKEAQRVSYPSVKMIYKSKNGTRIYLNDNPEDEFIRIADSTGKKFEINSTKDTIQMCDKGIFIKIENDIIYLGNEERHLTIDCSNSINITTDKGNNTINIKDNGETSLITDRVEIETDQVGVSYRDMILTDGNYNPPIIDDEDDENDENNQDSTEDDTNT